MRDEFQDIAESSKIELPRNLSTLMELVSSTPGHALLGSLYDFEWLKVDEAEHLIEQWLNPGKQCGVSFLPFAQNAAGDAYCLVQLEGGITGIALIAHDDEKTWIEFAGVSELITSEYVHLAANLTLIDAKPELAYELQHEIELIKGVLNPEHYCLLIGYFSRDCVERPYKSGPRAKPVSVKSFISQDEKVDLLATLCQDDRVELEVSLEWE